MNNTIPSKYARYDPKTEMLLDPIRNWDIEFESLQNQINEIVISVGGTPVTAGSDIFPIGSGQSVGSGLWHFYKVGKASFVTMSDLEFTVAINQMTTDFVAPFTGNTNVVNVLSIPSRRCSNVATC